MVHQHPAQLTHQPTGLGVVPKRLECADGEAVISGLVKLSLKEQLHIDPLAAKVYGRYCGKGVVCQIGVLIRRQRLIFVGEIVVPNGLDLPQIAVGPGPVQHGIKQRAFPVPPGNGIGLLSPVAADPVLYCALILLVEQLEELGVFFAQREIVLFHVPRCAS